MGTSSSPPPIHSLGIGISHRAIITHQAISDERWGSPIEYSVRWTPAVPGESRVWPWRSHERWWCVSRRRGRAPSFSGVCPGETVSMSRCSSEDPKWQLLPHSGDPRTIHFPTDDEQAKWDAALHRRAYATDTSTIGRTTCSFRFRTRIVQDVVATFYQMKL